MDLCLEVLAERFPEAEYGRWMAACERLVHASMEDEGWGVRRRLAEGFANFEEFDDYINLMGALFCMVLAAMAAGLTMGIVSLESIDLRVKIETGDEREKQYATKLLPLVEKSPHHLVLVTLLLANSLANEALPLFLDKLVPSWAAILTSVTVVLFVGELIPSAVFTGPSKLQVAAASVPLANLLIGLVLPLAYPLALLLDRVMPEEPTFTSIREVQALVNIERELAEKLKSEAAFHEDAADLVDGIMALSEKKVEDRMVPIDKVFTISSDEAFTLSVLESIANSGFSRIPMREASTRHCQRFLLVKELVATPLQPPKKIIDIERAIFSPVWTAPDHSLFSLLNEFQTGKSHIAFVSPNHQAATRQKKLIGIITLEDIMETIITEKIYDEADRKHAASTISQFFQQKVSGSRSFKKESNDEDLELTEAAEEKIVAKQVPVPKNTNRHHRHTLLLAVQNKSISHRNLMNVPATTTSNRPSFRRARSNPQRKAQDQQPPQSIEPLSISTSERDALLRPRQTSSLFPTFASTPASAIADATHNPAADASSSSSSTTTTTTTHNPLQNV